jgi:hypothetical protein
MSAQLKCLPCVCYTATAVVMLSLLLLLLLLLMMFSSTKQLHTSNDCFIPESSSEINATPLYSFA